MSSLVPLSQACDRIALDLILGWLQADQAGRAEHFLSAYLDPSSGVSTTPDTVFRLFGGGGAKDSDLTAPSGRGATVEPTSNTDVTAPVSCIPDEDLYAELLGVQVEGPDACGHRAGRLICARGVHPFNPNGHVYLNLTGSEVPDRHTETSEMQ